MSESMELAKEVITRCRQLATFSEDITGTRRTFLSPPMRDCHRELGEWAQRLGAAVRIDAAGNWRAVHPAEKIEGPRLLLGSHLDTVPNAGAFDGILGVVLAVSLLQALNGRRLPFGIEVVGFSEEEGVRFGAPFIGSRALVGRLDEEIPGAVLKYDILGYLEFHIEQGPVLENLGRPLAAVEAIAGQDRLEFTFLGRTNHAGTTPMNLRYDALAGAAEWISAVERHAGQISGLVATVGKIDAKPGATNVISGETRVTLDIRHAVDESRRMALDDLIRLAEEIAQRRGLSVSRKVLLRQKAVAMDALLVNQIELAIRQTGCKPHRMASGAGHDAMILAERVPSAMVFLRSPGGMSHDPAECVKVEDVALAIECGLHLLDQLASSPASQTGL